MYVSSGDELLREFVYKSYLNKNSIQEVYFRSILSKRKQIANLCGFKTYSHRANLTSILETPEKIVDFLENCSKSIMPKAKSDFELIKQFKKKTFNSDLPLMQWDVPYLSNMIKKQTFNLDKNHYCNYFSLGSCMEGLNMIFNNLYGVTLEVSQFEPGETWHKDIYKLAVKDTKSNDLLGYIYCDFYSRENKYSNIDCHFTIQCSKLLSVSTKSYQIPIVVLHLNFSPPTLERPTLLTFEMMENLFHEFGHAMHSMFAKTRYQHVSGTRCSTDLAEVPSQLMEYYCREPKILKLFAKHYSTMESLDDETLHKLCESKKLFAACDLQTQLLNSLLDQAYHLTDFEQDNITPLEINEKYTNEFYSLPFVANTYTHLRYNHLIGYGAKYYSYVVSKAIAARIWTDVFEKDPLSRQAGENYRKKLLEHGGEIKADKLISSLIGFDLNTNDLVKSLTKNITCL
jgi:mitochondrial intermediate peptidase